MSKDLDDVRLQNMEVLRGRALQGEGRVSAIVLMLKHT